MNVLHLEDNLADATLVADLLKEEWPDCEVTWVRDLPEFERDLRAIPYDVILSDFSMGSCDGLEALAVAQRDRPEIPFIFLSGTIGESRAIEAVRAGARDYVLKDNLRRLVTTIRRALRERDERLQRAAAEENQRRFAEVLESATDFVGLLAKDGRVFYVNRAGLRMTGRPPTFDPGLLSAADLHPPDLRARFDHEIIPQVHAQGSWMGETVLLGAGGERIPVSQAIIAHEAPEGGVAYYSTIMRDLTASKKAEQHIREQADLLNKARDAIVVSNLDGQVTFWNQGAERILGWTAPEAIGRPLRELLGDDAYPDDATVLAAEADGEWREDVISRTKKGDSLVLEVRVTLVRDEEGRIRSRLSIATDITKRRRVEEQFLRAQRLESIGMLATGIAHDLNNVLAPILMATPMLRERSTDPADRQLLSNLEASAQRGAGLVRQILGFAQGIGGEPQLMMLETVLTDIVAVVSQTFPRNLKFSTSIAPDLWPVKANTTQVHQVLLNLCVNARDAMPAGGRLELSAENIVLDALSAATMEGARPGAFVVMQVRDTGGGIPPEIQKRVWEPFFTTKGADKGTGLGLSTVLGIVTQHHGFVTLKSEEGRGSTFRVHLPAVLTAPQEEVKPVAPHRPRGNGELILIVDDEQDVREVTAAILAHHGYRVLRAVDGAEAVTLLAPRAHEVRIVVTDLQMPHLDGASLASVVRRLNPEIHLIVMSGMDANRAAETVRSFAGAFLAKPFKAEDLLGAVARLLQAPAASASR